MKPGLVVSRISIGSLVIATALAANAGTQLKLLKGNFKTTDLASQYQLQDLALPVAADYILQFKASVTEAAKKDLKDHGIQVFRYLPDDALIVRATATQLQNYANTHAAINAFVAYQPEFRIGSNVPTISVFSKGHRERMMVSTFLESDRANVEKQILAWDPSARILQSSGKSIDLILDLGQAQNVAGITGVEFLQKFEQMSLQDMRLLDAVASAPAAAGNYADLTGFESGTKVMNLQSAWDQGFIGAGQTAAMADTGLDLGDVSKVSQDFQNAIHSGYALGIGAKDWSDPMGHGTHVSGSVIGRGIISGGKIRGGAYGASFIAEGMWSPIADNLTVPPQLNQLFEPAYNDGARVHTNSWGAAGNFGAYDSMAQQVDQYMWDHPDFLILYAAGNSGTDPNKTGRIDPNSIGSPGTAKNCLTVGASKNYVLTGGIQKKISELRTAATSWPAEPISSSYLSETPDGLAMFSSRGPTADNRIKPDVVAPGTNILSTRSHVTGSDTLWGAFNDDYLWSGGTSMATPLAAGFAVVTREILTKRWNQANPSAALVKAVMMHTAFDMYPGEFGIRQQGQEILTNRPNSDEGYGRLDMNKVLAMGSTTKMFDQTEGVAEGASFEQTLRLTAGQKLTANMVYTDAPATPGAGSTLVNNLDLVVVSPDGQEIGSHDTVNNAEVIDLTATTSGTYKIQVKGVKIPMGKNGKQPFALVFSTL